MKCRNCKHGKLGGRLNRSQKLRYSLANTLVEGHEPSRRRKYEILREISAEFCKLGKTNSHNQCSSYMRRWWKFWVDQVK